MVLLKPALFGKAKAKQETYVTVREVWSPEVEEAGRAQESIVRVATLGLKLQPARDVGDPRRMHVPDTPPSSLQRGRSPGPVHCPPLSKVTRLVLLAPRLYPSLPTLVWHALRLTIGL